MKEYQLFLLFPLFPNQRPLHSESIEYKNLSFLFLNSSKRNLSSSAQLTIILLNFLLYIILPIQRWHTTDSRLSISRY